MFITATVHIVIPSGGTVQTLYQRQSRLDCRKTEPKESKGEDFGKIGRER